MIYLFLTSLQILKNEKIKIKISNSFKIITLGIIFYILIYIFKLKIILSNPYFECLVLLIS
jgi:hypothetical protein